MTQELSASECHDLQIAVNTLAGRGVPVALLGDTHHGILVRVASGFMHPRTFLDVCYAENILRPRSLRR